MDEVRVASWTELQEQLFEEAWREDLARHRSNFAFRGRADAAEGLETSLIRLGGDARTLEGYLVRNFRKYAQDRDLPSDSVWDWLALGQHHGLPTRLLDWTYSPYVALHFTTANHERFHRDGVVWTIDYVRAREVLPDALRDVLEHEGANVFTPELLERAAPGLRELDELASEACCLFLEPPSLDARIVNQYALFSLLTDPTVPLDDWLERHPELGRKLVIPAELKWEIRDKLDQANITERVLFPGLDGLTRWLARYYRPREGLSPGREPAASSHRRL
ncbi:MAG TPA: FRG domain-containing protein [Gaiellaceae bacterium]|nr:FRG domain-containing protein [Gaiellaceae bacterium]